MLAAGTRTEKTAETRQALLQQATALSSLPPAPSEVEMATRYLTDRIAFETETVTGVARLVAKLRPVAVLSPREELAVVREIPGFERSRWLENWGHPPSTTRHR